jgi:cohesin complex subunit SCC1
MPSRDALLLQDVLTEGDNLEMPPLPDASFLFSQLDDDAAAPSRKRRAGSRDINLREEFTGSQFLQNSIENNEEELNFDAMDEMDFGVDLGLDLGLETKGADDSVEIGRDAPAARATEDDLISEIDVRTPTKDLDVDGQDTTLNFGFTNDDDGIRLGDDDGDVDMFNAPDVSDLAAAPLARPPRISESPLSDVDETYAQEVEAEHLRNLNREVYEPEEEHDETVVVARQRARKQKFLVPDVTLQISNAVIKEQQKDRSKITQTQSTLPRDPVLLSLLEQQRNGGFVSSVLADTRSAGWAPELRGLISIDSVRSAGLKRKRDSGVADLESADEAPAKSPRLDFGEEDDAGIAVGGGDAFDANTTVAADGTILEIPGNDDEGIMAGQDEEEVFHGESPGPNFDETTAPLVHPADSGPVSQGTKHAVHLLRDQFGDSAANSPQQRKNASVLFQDLLPEKRTTKADATKMFFEILVLATKDAVKVEQQESLLGAPIRVRGKRGLWGDWAEREAGGEIETQDEAIAGPSRGLERSVAVAAAA